MRIAVMQPYLLPYLSYFQLIAAVDKFILLDDVHYINKGWINRNRLLQNDNVITFTIPLKKASQNKLIKDLEISYEANWQTKLLKTIAMAYSKAPYFHAVYPIVVQVLSANETRIAGLVYSSLLRVLEYLGIDTEIMPSSVGYANGHLRAQNKILDICLQEKANEYVNPLGGTALYEKSLFNQYGVGLLFLEPTLAEYEPSSSNHVPGLSMLDVMMHNSPEHIRQMLRQYRFA